MSEHLPDWVWVLVIREYDGSGEPIIRVYKTETRMREDVALLEETNCSMKLVPVQTEVIA